MARARGRPRTFDDEAAFHAITAVIAERGYPALTLATVAEKVGCGAQTLIDRFGSRQELLRAYVRWTIDRSAERFARMHASGGSPLDSLRAFLTEPSELRLDELEGSSAHAHFAAFIAESRSDPVLRPLMNERRNLFEREIIASLNAAHAAGELTPCDTTYLGRVLHLSLTGATILWSPERGTSSGEEVARVFDEVLGPYRTTTSLDAG